MTIRLKPLLIPLAPMLAALAGSTAISRYLNDPLLPLLLLGVTLTLLTLILLRNQTDRVRAPLRKIAHTLERIANGPLDLSLRIAPEESEVLGNELTGACNHLLDTLQQKTDSKSFIEQILGAMINGLLVLDRDNRIQRVNKALLTLLDEREETLLGRHLDELIPDPAFCAIMYRDMLAERLFRFQETTFLTADAREVAVSISSTLLRDGDSLAGTVILVEDIRQRKRNEEQLHFLANFDVLTQLPNRSLLAERLTQTLTRAPWRSTSVGLMHCALDRFKTINETLGHRAGDELLQETANRLRESVRDGDTVARVGGDEFLVLLLDIARSEDLINLARKISQAIAQPILLSTGQELFITASIGISLFPENGTSADELLKNADIATHFAKAQGKNQFSFFSGEMNRKGAQRLTLERDLRRAIERGELEAHYQPRWDLQKDQLAGAEALVRWRRGGDKLVPPGDFLPLAEELGLIEEIDLWMIAECCKQARIWLDQGHPPLRISINLSHHLFGRHDLVTVVRQLLDDTRIEPRQIELELTEAIVMHDVGHAMNTLLAFREMGIHLAVDDFGTGYSSFSHLRRLPVHILKIDRSFVREITTHHEDAVITEAIISLAHTLGLRATAEGAEEPAQRELLTRLGCDELQGYLISRPLPATELEQRFFAGR
ncbi:MAG: EAL domain-containing protein [Magnetococcus sp. YQC-9]